MQLTCALFKRLGMRRRIQARLNDPFSPISLISYSQKTLHIGIDRKVHIIVYQILKGTNHTKSMQLWLIWYGSIFEVTKSNEHNYNELPRKNIYLDSHSSYHNVLEEIFPVNTHIKYLHEYTTGFF